MLRVTLGKGLRASTPVSISWPNRTKPTKVMVDGKSVAAFEADGIDLDKPFGELIAQW